MLRFSRTKKCFRVVWAATLLVVSLLLNSVTVSAQQQQDDEPQLNGQHFRITTVQEGGFLTISGETVSGANLQFSGFLIDLLEAVASKANFTYDLVTPSGFGENCSPQLSLNNESSRSDMAYATRYRYQYNCATNDVNELQGTEYASDIYLGMFYISLVRSKKNWFTIPFQPPFKGTPGMYGTATRIANLDDLARQQAAGKQPPACMVGSTATLDFMKSNFPELQITSFFGDEQDTYDSMVTGECPVHILDAPLAAHYVLRRSQRGECYGAEGMPIGSIGEPMESGLSHYSIGVGKHLDRNVVDVMSHWMNVFMVDGTLGSFYEGQGGTGKECGYVLYPPEGDDNLLSAGGIAGVTLGAVAIVVIPLYFWYRYRLKQQEKRYKKRFVQQIARNIEIGRRPGCIAPEKLSEEILHIAQGKDTINKTDLSKWMHDIKMNFISQKDFDALWNAMDVDGRGEVDAVDFVVFLSACGSEFEEVYDEQLKMPKIERLKLAARRLSTLSLHGEDGVRQIERRLERSSCSTGFKPTERGDVSSSRSISAL